MVHDGFNWRMKKRRRALILSAALLPLLAFAASAVHAQSVMRTPNLNVGSRVPSINPVAPRTTPNIAALLGLTRLYGRVHGLYPTEAR